MKIDWKGLKYQSGFDNHFETCDPRYPDALPIGQNNPQKCAYGLYAEQISGTAFTMSRTVNRRSWLYRALPSVCHQPFQRCDHIHSIADWSKQHSTPNQRRWLPFPLDKCGDSDLLTGLRPVCGAGDPCLRNGLTIYVYSCGASMGHSSAYSSDGDWLIVPQQGALRIRTEQGCLLVVPNEICVIPQGVKFSVDVDSVCRGYILEVYNGHFQLPNLGPIGANGLANPRDFLYPSAWFEDEAVEQQTSAAYRILNKYQGEWFECWQDHTPFDVIAWHGNYAPFKYDLARFMVINATSFDHADPSIFTVLTCSSAVPGLAVADFVIFPPRWAVQEHTFRPPYYHRNCMSEFMGLIFGNYEAKQGGGFLPGGASLHSTMSAHGPDAECYQAASTCQLQPVRVADGTQAFMFETMFSMKMSQWASEACGCVDDTYHTCWQSIVNNFAANAVRKDSKNKQ